MFGKGQSLNSSNGLSTAISNGVVLPAQLGVQSDLSASLYQSASKSSSSDQAVGGSTLLTTETSWETQVNTFVSSYDCSGYGGYGGVVEPTPEPEVIRHFNQGIGNGSEGGDPGKSSPHGGSNDEGGRTPGQRWIPKLF
jgi:hypothetical protein